MKTKASGEERDDALAPLRLAVERASSEAQYAERRYMAVDPDNRLIARTLEADWEKALRKLSAALSTRPRLAENANAGAAMAGPSLPRPPNGQIYVEYQVPRKRTQPDPLVIVPGAAQTATNFNGTTDGREGWTQHFLRRGYAVYVVEQPGRARSSYQPDTDVSQAFPQVVRVQQRFTAPEKYNHWNA
jgi:hypothetical protein